MANECALAAFITITTYSKGTSRKCDDARHRVGQANGLRSSGAQADFMQNTLFALARENP